MANLKQRIAALEVVQVGSDPMTIIHAIVSPGNLHPNYNRIRADDGQAWTREPGETEQDFIDRASRVVTRDQWCNAQIIMSEVHHTNH